MKLIIGGAYQGKLDYVLERFNLTADDVYNCTESDSVLKTDKPVIYGFEKWIFALTRAEVDAIKMTAELLPRLADKIIISTDVSSGIVPIDPITRAWREEVGRATVVLAKNADEVIRMFVGIPTKIK